jgi:hypothetical protein
MTSARNRALYCKEQAAVSFEPYLDKRKGIRENHSYRNMRIECGMHIKGCGCRRRKKQQHGTEWDRGYGSYFRIFTTAADRSK